ncbi:hypothetical protein QC763_108030 [Podospora pseudopauciseta]|uniref:IBR domain-containing protein n=1 Tax=Podospora pseudopauciseta TaxID=2093780 RepID=A0ABR0HY22_9PEZI|nr:hypothetical protein QC763_108030 [Podospora pseudopauciseta]
MSLPFAIFCRPATLPPHLLRLHQQEQACLMAKGNNNMPSIAQETTNTSSPSSVPCKKRRRDDDRDNSTQQFTFSHHHHNIYPDNYHHYHHGSSSSSSSNLSPLATTTRKMIPLSSKRQRMTSVDIELDPKRQHDITSKFHQKEEETLPAKPRPNLASKTSLLTPCHICSRKPTKKSDLDSFADCQGCGQRTCYVCIRECLGWSPPSQQPPPPLSLQTEPSFTMIDVDSTEEQQPPPPVESGGWTTKGGGAGHRKMVCSRCCVERGQDGDVVCLGCLPFVEG